MKEMKIVFVIIFLLLPFGVIKANANENAPQIIGATDKTIEWTYDEPDWKIGVTAVDYDGNDLTDQIKILDDVVSKDVGVYTVTYSITNSLGVTSNKSIEITVVDHHLPSLFECGPFNVEVNTSKPIYSKLVAVKDDYDAHHAIPLALNYDDSNLDITQLGDYDVRVWATDSNGNRSEKTIHIPVEDTKKPIITEIEPLNIEVNQDNIDYLNGLEINDNYDKNPNIEILYGNLDITYPSMYDVTYNITDSSGNKTEFIRTIYVEDTIAPVMTGLNNLEINLGDEIDLLNGVSAIDNGDGDLTTSIVVTGHVNVNIPGTYTINYEVSDLFGNTTTQSVDIKVKDNIKPELNNVTDKTIKVNADFDPLSGITATDNIDGNISANIKSNKDFNTKIAGEYTITITVTDSFGNTAKQSYQLTVENNNNSLVITLSIVGIVTLGLTGFFLTHKFK